jgi:hypothetical protein
VGDEAIVVAGEGLAVAEAAGDKLRDWVATTRFGQRLAERVFEEMLLQAPPQLA